MAIKARNVSSDGKREMTMQEFKKWVRRLDANKDGMISRQELSDAVRVAGGRFSWLKCRQAVRTADSNGNGFIDDHEIDNLIDFAHKHLGVKIIHI